jgi:hypothetical protein
LTLDNPSPGDAVPSGHYVVSGAAKVPGSGDTSSGISRIDFFLGTRDAGGPIVGSAMTGTGVGGGVGSFQAVVFIPTVNEQFFTAYAYAANSSGVTSVTVPVQVGPQTKVTGATPTPVPARIITSTGCVNAAAGAPAGATSAPVNAPAVAVQPVGAPVLLLGNPNVGDVVSHGDYLISGIAYDPAAADSSGVDRVDFFLDNRDMGGQFLGSVIPGVAIPEHPRAFSGSIFFPTNMSGAHNFVAYAHSRLSNKETLVSVPIYVGAPPTPTPRAT